MTRTRLLAATGVVFLGLVGGACSGSPLADGTFAVPASFDVGVSAEPSRMLVGLVGPDGARLGAPDLAVEIEVAPADDPDAAQRAPGTFTWIVEDALGLYRASFVFDRPGTWLLTVRPEGGDPLETTGFEVLAETYSPNIGDDAPLVDTRTIDDAPLAALTTDPDPDPRFYEVSLADAVGEPTVLVFSTPAYCQTAACGPLLDHAKAVAAGHPDTTFIHVEVYTGFDEPGFVPGPEHLAPSAGPLYWNLPSEPWLFVIDSSGKVVARFEGVLDPVELEEALVLVE